MNILPGRESGGEVLALRAGLRSIQGVAQLVLSMLSLARGTPALSCAVDPGSEFHGGWTRRPLVEDLVALTVRRPVQELPAAGARGARVLPGVGPGRGHDGCLRRHHPGDQTVGCNCALWVCRESICSYFKFDHLFELVGIAIQLSYVKRDEFSVIS